MSQFPEADPHPDNQAGTNAVKIIAVVVGGLFVLSLVGCGVLALLLYPAVSAARDAARRQQTQNNLKMISLAMLNYESAYRTLPGAGGVDHQGNPTLSWRVTLLPFLDQVDVYNQVDHHKAWDAPENAFLLDQMPEVYRSTLAPPDQPAGHANMFMVREPNSLAPAPGVWRRISEITDGTSNTMSVIELPNRSVPWTKPDDLSLSEVLAAIRASDRPEAVSFATVDAAVHAVGGMDDAAIAGTVTVDGAEIVRIE